MTATPWGKSDYAKRYAVGVMFYETPSHGGFHLSPKKNVLVHSALRNDDGWYEEDCEWAKVALTFPALFTSEEYEGATKTAQTYFPETYKQFQTLTE